MNIKLLLCKLGFHKWRYNNRIDLRYAIKIPKRIRYCVKCEKIEDYSKKNKIMK